MADKCFIDFSAELNDILERGVEGLDPKIAKEIKELNQKLKNLDANSFLDLKKDAVRQAIVKKLGDLKNDFIAKKSMEADVNVAAKGIDTKRKLSGFLQHYINRIYSIRKSAEWRFTEKVNQAIGDMVSSGKKLEDRDIREADKLFSRLLENRTDDAIVAFLRRKGFNGDAKKLIFYGVKNGTHKVHRSINRRNPVPTKYCFQCTKKDRRRHTNGIRKVDPRVQKTERACGSC